MTAIELKITCWVSFIVLQSLVGYFLVKNKTTQLIVWGFPLLSILVSHYLFLHTSPIIRMLALIIPLLHSMKIVVANIHPKGKLSFSNWLIYYFLTVNMNPVVFTEKVNKEFDRKLFLNAIAHLLIGFIILISLRHFIAGRLSTESTIAFWCYSVLALFSLSLILHFGLLSLNTVILKQLGIADYPVFRQPFKSKSLSEFWGRRWNLAFSEMTAIAVFKPLAKQYGVRWAGFISFMISGLLHEVAISLSVMKNFGLPMLYFIIHGILMSLEKQIFKKKKPGTWWVVMSLIIPLPLLFHESFLVDVIWGLISLGIEK